MDSGSLSFESEQLDVPACSMETSRHKRVYTPGIAGLISCAECRRSKLKCDRIFPCSTCKRRGCADSCPEGLMEPSCYKGRRDLKNKTHQLSTEVDELKARVIELETMLEISHVNNSKCSMDFSPEIRDLLDAFPFGKRNHSYDLSIFMPYMPDKSTALFMARLYYLKLNTKTAALSSNNFFSTIFDPIYNNSTSSPSLEGVHPHRLSVFYATLALGGLSDIDDAHILVLAKMCISISRAALAFLPMTDRTSVCCATVQGLYLITRLTLVEDVETGITEESWMLLSMLTRLVFQLELHLDNDTSLFERSEESRDAARRIFWEIVIWDAWTSFMSNRPAYIALDRVHCPYPQSIICGVSHQPSEGSDWKYRFTHCVALIFKQIQSNARLPPYSSILEGDRIIRAFPVPSYATVVCAYQGEDFPWSEAMDQTIQQYIPFCIINLNLIFLHKIFLTEAILLNKDDPYATPYRYSVETVIRSAARILSGLSSIYKKHVKMANLSWTVSSSMSFACNTLANVIVQSPRSPGAPPVMCFLNSAIKLYERIAVSAESDSLNQLLPNLLSAREKALNAIAAAQVPPGQSQSSTSFSDLFESSLWSGLNGSSGALDASDFLQVGGGVDVLSQTEFSSWMARAAHEWGWSTSNVGGDTTNDTQRLD